MHSTIDHFDALTSRGLKIIPLWENSKIPLNKGWSQNWDRLDSRNALVRFPEANIGLLLGNIVDVEGDSEEANKTIIDLIGDYPHPCYHSTKSIHHLFQSPDPNLRHFRCGKIEFRGHGHQSVLPPSQHAGIKYCWLKSFKFPIPEMPESLVKFYEERKEHIKLNDTKPGHIRVWCSKCDSKVFLNEKRFKLELQAFKLLEAKWQCQSCRTVDLRHACRLIRSGVCDKRVFENQTT
jgi:hypothetical protein